MVSPLAPQASASTPQVLPCQDLRRPLRLVVPKVVPAVRVRRDRASPVSPIVPHFVWRCDLIELGGPQRTSSGQVGGVSLVLQVVHDDSDDRPVGRRLEYVIPQLPWSVYVRPDQTLDLGFLASVGE